MKSILFRILLASVFFFSFASCNQAAEVEEESLDLSVKTFLPSVAGVGQKISITGNQMDKVTAVVFAGDVTVTNIEHVGEFQVNVVVPEGAKDGQISVRTSDAQATSRANLSITAPKITNAYPRDITIGENVTITGKNLSVIQKIVFPDGVVIEAMDFKRKVMDEIVVKIPSNSIIGLGVVTLLTANDQVADTVHLNIKPKDKVYQNIDLWEGNVDLGAWNSTAQVDGAMFAKVKPESEITITYELTASGAQFKISSSIDWIGWPEASNNSWGGYDLASGSTSLSFNITAASLEKLVGQKMNIQGQKAIVTKVTAKVLVSE